MPEIYKNIKRAADIDYMSRDFDSLRRKLTDYIRQNFPDTFSDFSDESSGMAILETVCYAGDILNFYLDKQFNELFLQTAIEEKNVVALANNLGYKIKGNAAAQGHVTFNFNYPTSGIVTSFDFILKKGTRFANNAGDATFEMVDDIDTGTVTSITRIIDVVNNVTSASISGIQVLAGTSKTYQVRIGAPVAFLRLPLPESNILEILSVTSSDGNTWYEVDYLAQENQMVGLMNSQSTSGAVPYVLTLRRVPRRFTVERNTSGEMNLRFGSGVLSQNDSEFIPNPEDFIIPYTLRGTVSGFSPAAVDPSDFVNTGTLGAAPSNVTLTIKYRSGGGLKSNASINTITTILGKIIEYKASGNTFDKSIMESTMKAFNFDPILGGADPETLDQIKYNASAFYAAQSRCVTHQDYIVRTYTLPSKFGSIFRASAGRDASDRLGVKLSVLARNSDKTLTASTTALKVNLVKYLDQFRSLSDNVKIADGRIINFGIRFGIVTDQTLNQQEVLANCIMTLQDYFNIEKWNMGQSISISLVHKAVTDVSGVLAVPRLDFIQFNAGIQDRIYSQSHQFYNMQSSTRNNIISCDPDMIFELRYPNYDILGSVLT